MLELDNLFNATVTDRAPNPAIKFDWKNGETIRFRLGTGMNQLKLLIRHFVPGIGYVACNQKPFKKKDGTFGLWGECLFCQIRKQAKLALGDKPTKADQDAANKVMQRYISLIGAAEVEVRRGREVVKPLESKAIVFRASDMFFDNLNQHYKVLKNVHESKGDITQYWFLMNGKNELGRDDKCEPEELKTPIEVDLSFYDKQTKTYEVGVEKYGAHAVAVEEAEPLTEEDDSEIAF